MANIKEMLSGTKHCVKEGSKTGFSATTTLAIALVWFGTNGLAENTKAHTQNEPSTVQQSEQSKDRFILIPSPKATTQKSKEKMRTPPTRITSISPPKPPEPEISQDITHEIIYTGENEIKKYKIQATETDIVIIFGNTAQSGKNHNGGNDQRGVLATLNPGEIHTVRIEEGGYEIYHHVPKERLSEFKKQVLKERIVQQSNDHYVREKNLDEIPEWSSQPKSTSNSKSSPQ